LSDAPDPRRIDDASHGESLPVTATRILIGILFCISGGTKLFVKAPLEVLEETMVQMRTPSRTQQRCS
jgi:hypothetical protein